MYTVIITDLDEHYHPRGQDEHTGAQHRELSAADLHASRLVEYHVARGRLCQARIAPIPPRVFALNQWVCVGPHIGQAGLFGSRIAISDGHEGLGRVLDHAPTTGEYLVTDADGVPKAWIHWSRLT